MGTVPILLLLVLLKKYRGSQDSFHIFMFLVQNSTTNTFKSLAPASRTLSPVDSVYCFTSSFLPSFFSMTSATILVQNLITSLLDSGVSLLIHVCSPGMVHCYCSPVSCSSVVDASL